jgi:hypothetical protein
MGILNYLGLGKDLAEPIKAVGDLYTTDKARLEAETALAEVTQKPTLAQLANNALMLASGRFFESAWPALIGWTSGACVFLYWVPQLVVTDYLWAMQCYSAGAALPYPIKSDDIYNLVWLLFGFGGFNLIKTKVGR